MKPSEYREVVYSYQDYIATLTINRPERMNALTPRAWDELTDGILRSGSDPTVAAIVLRGAGERAFCAGGDLSNERGGGGEEEFSDISSLPEAIRQSQVPVISAVKGYAIGGGNWLAYLCDITVAADNAIFGQVGARLGSSPAGFYVAALSRAVGEKRAREMWYFCHRYSAQEAKAMGLVNFVFPLAEFDEKLSELCQELVHRSPTTIKMLKMSFDMGLDAIRPLRDTFLMAAAGTQQRASEELVEGSAAFREKREPDYSRFRQPRIT